MTTRTKEDWDSLKARWAALLGRTPREYELIDGLVLEALEKIKEACEDHYHVRPYDSD